MMRVNTLGTGWSPLPFHLLRAASANPDLKAAITGRGFRIAIPQKDTSDELTFRRVLAFYGTSYERIERDGGKVAFGSYDEIAAALKTSEADYLFGATTKPAAIIADIGNGPRKIALTAMPAELMAHLTSRYGYGRDLSEAAIRRCRDDLHGDDLHDLVGGPGRGGLQAHEGAPRPPRAIGIGPCKPCGFRS